MSDRERPTEIEDTEEKTTDVGERKRSVITSGRGGIFAQTPGESGDRAEDPAGGPDAVPPHRQKPD
jgi:hypothetical protein